MKAVSIDRFGAPDVLTLVDVDAPRPGPSDILVRVHAAGVNFAETLQRQDRYAMTPPLPSILGSEAAGVIEAVGGDVAGFSVGDRVAAPLFAAGIHFGGYAELVAIDHRYAVGIPDAVSFETAAALMVQGLTADHLTRQASPTGKVVLITAAAGGVGSQLVQIARLRCAKTIVAAAGSTEKLDFARRLGADIAIDYTRTDWTEALLTATGGEKPDIVYDSVGGDITMDCLKLLAPVGQMVLYGALNIQSFQLGVPDLLGLIFNNQSLTGFALVPLLTPDILRQSLGDLFGLAASGALKVEIGRTFPLAEAAEAHRALGDRKTRGKIVLLP
ncbi:Quinone oxidoreductase 1 [Hartmannibacter diazotrophicus]|uniref:Quinone oxidoreductase 1 n=1 Tax=Hartmannibacter diazotrophicus TaxID=1482074 RepID=A0A2C9D8Q7_9HYPH|nr:zinc-binding dehydrogenase [Hartmannibacter diazotrophicus]SON56613.1 Quinone oxidoreductase 1 [Hartmannibacter diazotrophicus]